LGDLNSSSFLGVWDTVGSIHETIDALGIKDNILPACVDTAYHALAMHENRENFSPTLFTEVADETKSTLVEVRIPQPDYLCLMAKSSGSLARIRMSAEARRLTNSRTFRSFGWWYMISFLFSRSSY